MKYLRPRVLRTLIVFVCVFCSVAFPAAAHPLPQSTATATAALNLPVTVKENADVGATGYPVSVVIPLPRGQYKDTTNLGIAGAPSQVEVLERWNDNSLRQVLVHFQPTVGVHGNAGYTFTDGGRTPPSTPVTVSDAPTVITVNTGPLRFTVSKSAFTLLDQVWLDQNNNGVFEAAEQIMASNAQNGGVFTPRSGAGGVQYDSARRDLKVTIEESGPLRAVLRIEATTQFISTTQHIHGFAARIYAYAGQPFVKIDYQLQNSAKNVARAWPLYFEEMKLDFRPTLSGVVTSTFGLGKGAVYTTNATAYLAQEQHNRFKIYNAQTKAVLYDSGGLANGNGPEGFVDLSDSQRGVTAVIRNLWQTWPNGLAVEGGNKLSLQLWPAWSSQWENRYTNDQGVDVPARFTPSGLYWLGDMQQYYKETLLYFHGPKPANAQLSNLARTFQFYPVAIVPTDWYRQTQATLDLGGVTPPAAVIPTATDKRQPTYPDSWTWDTNSPYYGFGWINFGEPEPGYRAQHSCTTGGWPYSVAQFMAQGNPADYFTAEAYGQAELNLRPEWIAQYTHDADWNRLHLTENPYCGGSWRIFEGFGSPIFAAPLLPDTANRVFAARDDQHGWFYHVAEAYLFTGNPWIKDWYKFIAEFRRVRLGNLDPASDLNDRAIGHALNHAIQAYRVSGDATLLTQFRAYLLTSLRVNQDPLYGDQKDTIANSGGATGYLMRALVDYLEEVRGKDAQAYAEGFNYLSGLIEWNYNFGNFPYFFNARKFPGKHGASSLAGSSIIDPEAWYYWHTGKQKYLTHINQYVTTGIPGFDSSGVASNGELPAGDFSQWQGDFQARSYLFVKNNTRPDSTPPAAITNLTATKVDTTTTQLQWTAPAEGQRYHIVWSNKPIVEANSLDPAQTNWWAANAVGPNLAVTPGAQQSWRINTGNTTPVYVAIFTFDAADNMSTLSNVALAQSSTGPTATPTAPPTGTSTPTGTPTPTLTPTSSPTGRVIEIYPSNADVSCNEEFENIANTLQPGDQLILHGGSYSQSCGRKLTINGAAAKPIIIRAATGEAPILTRPDSPTYSYDQNNMEIISSSYLVLRGLHFKGGDVGLRFLGVNHHITLEENEFYNTGDNGVTMNTGNTDSFIIRKNHVHHTGLLSTGGSVTGEGFYIGCQDSSCIGTNHLLDNNYIHDLRGSGDAANDGIEIKPGSYGNTVRNNVIHNTNLGGFSPCIFVYGVPSSVAPKPNLVEGNAVWNCGEAIQVASDAIIRNNLILNSRVGIQAAPHPQAPRTSNVQIVNNTLYGSNPCLYVNWSNAATNVLANNAIYCPGTTAVTLISLGGATARANYLEGALNGAALDNVQFFNGGSAANVFINPAALNFWPKPGSVLLNTANATYAPAQDFNETARTTPFDVGAYETNGQATNPGWAVTTNFKYAPAPPPISGCVIAINDAALYTSNRVVNVRVNLTGAAQMQLSNDGSFIGATWQAYAPLTTWTLRDIGSRIATLLVYARFRDAAGALLCNGAPLIDDIIYDPLAPKVTGLAFAAGQLQVTAEDQPGGSGITDLQVSAQADFAEAGWQPFVAALAWPAPSSGALYVRVRDGAGNESEPVSTTVQSASQIFLPFIVR
ncbi:MAG: right-handed parallel beta-helix repeat-containing protein [Caldilineaceae bacterium]